MAKLSYFYDGYLFCRSQAAAVNSNKILNPVTVSLFLTDPESGFLNYWHNTGANSTFLFKLLNLCSEALIGDVLDKLFDNSPDADKSLDPSVIDYIKAWVPALALSVDVDDNNEQNHRLLKVPTNLLKVKLDIGSPLNKYNAIPILFQAGYLTIKAIKDDEALLGFANHEVASSLKSILRDDSLFIDSDPFGLSEKFSRLNKPASEIFANFHAGGETLANFLDDLLNTAPELLFAAHESENLLSYLIYLALDHAQLARERKVHYVLGRADLVLYKSNEESLLSDTVIEFKVARQGENVLKKLAAGAKQIVDKRYGISCKNPDPVRYCIAASEIFANFHAGGETLANFLDDLLNTAPELLFAAHESENLLSYLIYLALDHAQLARERKVHYVLGRADLVLYKSNEESLLSDTVIEFKVARQGENVLKKLAAGAKQIVDKRYGISCKNPDPVRYCIVFSNDLRQVGAIGAVTGDGSYEVTYLSSKLTKRGTLRAMYRKATSTI